MSSPLVPSASVSVPTEEISEIGVLIHKLRDNALYTQRELAEKLGFSQMAVSYWESGGRRPSQRAMHGLIVVFGRHEKELRAAYFAYPKEGKK